MCVCVCGISKGGIGGVQIRVCIEELEGYFINLHGESFLFSLIKPFLPFLYGRRPVSPRLLSCDHSALQGPVSGIPLKESHVRVGVGMCEKFRTL